MNWNEIKTIVFPITSFRTVLTKQFGSTGSKKVTTGMSNEGLNILEWIQARIDDDDLNFVGVAGTDLGVAINGDKHMVITSSTGADVILTNATSVADGTMSYRDKQDLDVTVSLVNDLGTFTGTIISDNTDLAAALQELETAIDSGVAGNTNLTFSGSSSPVQLLSSTGTDVTFTAGTGISLSQTGDNLTITNTQTEVNGIYTGSGTIPNGTLARLYASGAFAFGYNNLTSALVLNDVSGSIALYDKTGDSFIEVDGAGVTVGISDKMIIFNTGGDAVMTDNIDSKGLVYAGEYRTNFVDLSLVHKAYVDDEIAAAVFSSGGSGTVTSVAISGGTTGLTTSGGPITTSGTITLAGTLNIANGGTGLNGVSQGDIFYGSATDVISKLGKSTTATRYLSNTGTSNNPAWAQINLTNGVTGVLPVANGGAPSGTTGQTLYYNGTTLTATSTLTNNGTNVAVGSSPTSAKFSVAGYLETVNGIIMSKGTGDGTGSTAASTLRLYNTGTGVVWNFVSADDTDMKIYGGGVSPAIILKATGGLETSGDINITNVGGKLKIATGSNASIGTATLVAGTVTVATTAVTSSSKIFLTRNTTGGTLGHLSTPTASIVNATSFVINSSDVADTSTVNWLIIN